MVALLSRFWIFDQNVAHVDRFSGFDSEISAKLDALVRDIHG